MTRREDGRWVETITVKVNGRSQRKYFYGATKREVLLKMAAYEEEQEQGKLWVDVCDEWWAEASPKLAHNTLRSETPAYRRARDSFPGMRIRDITPSMVARQMDKLIASQHMKRKTAATQLGSFRRAFRYAVLHDYVEINPVRDIQIPEGLEHTPRDLPSRRDVQTIARTEGREGDGSLYAYMALYTGLRKGELLGLTWGDIDLDERIITVQRSVYSQGGKGYVKEPKTKAGIRYIPIVDALAQTLDKLKQPKTKKLFTVNGEWMSEGMFEKLWRDFSREYEITCTSHQLRHELATLLLENDVPVSTARIILGHADTQTTEKVYQHIRDAHRKSKIQEIKHLRLEDEE